MRVVGDEIQSDVLPIADAIRLAKDLGLDLVEIVPKSDPPVCRVINYEKFLYEKKKKEKELKAKSSRQVTKEIRFGPNTDEHDLMVKIKHAREFITKGNKVRVTCVFRGREMLHPEFGQRAIHRICEELADVATPETSARMLGRNMSVVLAPGAKKKTANS